MGAVLNRYGNLDILVNSAGVDHPLDNIGECDDSIWNFVMDVNLDGTFIGCRQATPSIRRAGGTSIINLTSVLVLRGDGGSLAYCASKGAVLALTKSIASFCGQQRNGVRCNAIWSGYMFIRMLRKYLDSTDDREVQHARLAAFHPLQRLGDADDVANLVVFLASDESRFVTGTEIAVDGGFTAI